MNVLTIVGFGLPIVGYFWFIAHYGVNVPYQDGWSDMTVIHQCYSHLFTCGALWTQHNEDRLLFPNLVVVILAHTTHFNIKGEEFLSGLMLVAATFLLIHAHKRRSPDVPWLYYCPVVILACSLVQYGATLWGFQLAWYLVLLALASVVVFLDRDKLGAPTLALAIGAGVIGSFSSLQGLLIWPVGMVLIFYRRRSRPVVTAWVVSACATTALYFYHLNIHSGTALPSSLTHHSISPILFAIFAIGDVLGVPIKPGGSDVGILLFGLAIVVLALAALKLCGLGPDRTSARPVGATLIWFGFLFSIVVAVGRHGLGYWGASSSGYTIYNVWILIGVYMVLLARNPRTTGGGAGSTRYSESVPKVVRRNAYRYALWVVLAFLALQPLIGVGNGLDGARTIHAAELRSVATAVNINNASGFDVLDNLSFYQSVPLTETQVHIAAALRLTIFAGTRLTITASPPTVPAPHASLPHLNAQTWPITVFWPDYGPGEYTKVGEWEGHYVGHQVSGGAPVYANVFGGFMQDYNVSTLPVGTGIYIPTSLAEYEDLSPPLPHLNAQSWPITVFWPDYGPGEYTKVGEWEGHYVGHQVSGGAPVYANVFGGFMQDYNVSTLPVGTGIYIPTSLAGYEDP